MLTARGIRAHGRVVHIGASLVAAGVLAVATVTGAAAAPVSAAPASPTPNPTPNPMPTPGPSPAAGPDASVPVPPEPSGLLVSLTATHGQVAFGQPITYQLGVLNLDLSPRPDLDLIDVLPFQGDERTPPTRLAGTVRLAEPLALPAGEGAWYTSAPAPTVSPDPTAPGNQADGRTRWCAETEFATPGCPSGLAEVSAVRITRTAALLPGERMTRSVVLVSDSAHDGDQVTNRFVARTLGGDAPVVSGDSPVTLSAGRIGEHVWIDQDQDGVRDPREPPLPGARVRLSGHDPDGAPVNAITTTDARGVYVFDGLPPGVYTVRVSPPQDGFGYTFTATGGGADVQFDSDAGDDGVTAPTDLLASRDPTGVLTYISSDTTVDVGLIRTDAPAGAAPVSPAVTGDVTGDGLGPATSDAASDQVTVKLGAELVRAGAIGLLLVAISVFVLAGCVFLAWRPRPDIRDYPLL